MEVFSKSSQQTKELAFRIAKTIKKRSVLALYGDLGAGKTTFVSGLVEALGIKARVQSPTFVLIRHYRNKGLVGKANAAGNKLCKANRKINVVNHIDLYRLKDFQEAKDLGITELFLEPNSISVIEWPGVIEAELPKDTIKIFFEVFGEDKRKITYA